MRAGDETKRKQLASEVQKVALSEVTYVPWGEWFQPTAFSKNVRDVLKFGAPAKSLTNSFLPRTKLS